MLNKQRPEKKAREAATEGSTIANQRDALTNLRQTGPLGETCPRLAANKGESFNGETDDWHGRPCVTNPSSMSTDILLCRDVPESGQAPREEIDEIDKSIHWQPFFALINANLFLSWRQSKSWLSRRTVVQIGFMISSISQASGQLSLGLKRIELAAAATLLLDPVEVELFDEQARRWPTP